MPWQPLLILMGFDGAWIFVKIHIACQLQLPKICGMHVLLCQHYLVSDVPRFNKHRFISFASVNALPP